MPTFRNALPRRLEYIRFVSYGDGTSSPNTQASDRAGRRILNDRSLRLCTRFFGKERGFAYSYLFLRCSSVSKGGATESKRSCANVEENFGMQDPLSLSNHFSSLTVRRFLAIAGS